MTIHAIARIQERYGRLLDFKDLNNIISGIKNGLKIVVHNDYSSNVEIIIVKYDNIPYKLIYETHKNIIITALPLDIEEINKYHGKIENIEKRDPDYMQSENYNHLKNLFIESHPKFEIRLKENIQHIIEQGIKINIMGKYGNFILFWYKFDKNKVHCYIKQIDKLKDEILKHLRPILHSNKQEKFKKTYNLLNRILNAKEIQTIPQTTI